MTPMPRLTDRFDLKKADQLLNGMQAIVRLVLMQKARDSAAGLNTAGFVTGYRGSPIATLEAAFALAGERVQDANILFQPAINEDLAATAVWGSQQAELRGEGKFDGVFGVWYGKGPGVDRSGDALRHANHAGTAKHGGVIALMGDDHICESSTSAHQSEFAFVDAMIPILNPSGVQDLIDLGIYGIALSRYAGTWVGIKCVKDNVESTAVVDGTPERIEITLPSDEQFRMPPGGLNIRLNDPPLAKEQRWHDYKRDAIHAFTRANAIDRIVFDGGCSARIGVIASGKSYADARQALEMLGIDEERASRLGLRLYKPALVWPLEPQELKRFATGLQTIIVVEEKRALIEAQVKELLYDLEQRPRVIGKTDETGAELFPSSGALDPLHVAIAIGRRLAMACDDASLSRRTEQLAAADKRRPTAPEAMQRRAYFCAGCPHNTSTRVPEGARAYAGIGCHYMVQWMDRETEGFTQMGAEGANWIGEAPFSRRRHVYQNIGDGTYVHSGSLAIRAAIASGVTMTYKLLFNDAVAMTGGQHLDGGMTLEQMARQMVEEGAARVAVVSSAPEKYHAGSFPKTVTVHPREDFDTVQIDLAAVDGVSVLIYDQTCAAELRRRRKRGITPDPTHRIAINPRVCEGCGDCGVVSNCIAINPLDTPFGRKRIIDQSACNKDLSCIDGLCPSFFTLEGATPRKRTAAALDLPLHLPEPEPARLDRPLAMIATGIGGTGVVTITAVLGQAAHIAGIGFGAIDVTGIAQKGGPVVCHMRFARSPDDIHAIRIGIEGAEVVLGGDLVVTASNKVLEMAAPGHTALLVSRHSATSGDFTRMPDLTTPTEELVAAIERRAGTGSFELVDAHDIAVSLLGDAIYANMMLVGSAYQKGLLPISSHDVETAIKVNGIDIANNIQAFRLGRMAIHAPAELAALAGNRINSGNALCQSSRQQSQPPALENLIDSRAQELVAYQGTYLSGQYQRRVRSIQSAEQNALPGAKALTETVAQTYYRLLAVKDEYEVARFYSDAQFKREIAENFSGVKAIHIYLAPPLLARTDPETGRPRKRRFGPWILPLLRLLSKGKRLRGTRLDLFGLTTERRNEQRLREDYEADLDLIESVLTVDTLAEAAAFAAWPDTIRGYGMVKHDAMVRARQQRADLLLAFERAASHANRSAAE
ncbi:MAG: indolepyruvate ferredoxin oxidoreductase family protein [Hyphomicrobiaceae bacterium]|nr:indolepyruvate ferredoxin oxidoreductase family protein [Hyphomicrobiaceae bacterium]MCC0010486.1 indolepyruvate ferredoxin oxidoreductase family protein [Hyphomicrobiaceae bacterium]